ncbi:hypothetical protein EP073_07220 [Geovibrio thiophilus]|uniref:Uncharacterized protein n=1 Tax=Geovibrio thiophilus TaxID=139438 RepID=A0A3R6AY33_9BACT|nr:hypothetical protein [Geovibrio thiophilus]QAR33199.1 hypothetical protein EP073_07220 [Geovibrio thiophilus]
MNRKHRSKFFGFMAVPPAGLFMILTLMKRLNKVKNTFERKPARSGLNFYEKKEENRISASGLLPLKVIKTSS